MNPEIRVTLYPTKGGFGLSIRRIECGWTYVAVRRYYKDYDKALASAHREAGRPYPLGISICDNVPTHLRTSTKERKS